MYAKREETLSALTQIQKSFTTFICIHTKQQKTRSCMETISTPQSQQGVESMKRIFEKESHWKVWKRFDAVSSVLCWENWTQTKVIFIRARVEVDESSTSVRSWEKRLFAENFSLQLKNKRHQTSCDDCESVFMWFWLEFGKTCVASDGWGWLLCQWQRWNSSRDWLAWASSLRWFYSLIKRAQEH